MKKEMIKRLELLETAAHEKVKRQEESAKSLYVKIVDNEAKLWHSDKVYKVTGKTVFDVVNGVEDYIRGVRELSKGHHIA